MNVDDFIDYLIKLVKKERKLQIEAMKAEIRRMSGIRREKAGRAILNLKGRVIGTQFGYVYVRYGRARDIETEISQGDVVLISRMGTDPLKSDLLATVAEKGRRFITVALKNLPEWALKDVRIDLYSSETTFSRMLDNLRNLGENGRKAIEIYLGLRKPEKEEVCFKPVDDLNESQIKAVSLALGSECFVIHGPFGTGKTRTLAELVRQKEGKILATASSNVAVDNFLMYLLKRGKTKAVRIGHPARVCKEVFEHSIPYLMEKHPDYEEIREINDQIRELTSKRDMYEKPKPKWRRGLSDEEILRAAERGMALRGLPPRLLISMAEWIRHSKEIEKLLRERAELERKIQLEILNDAKAVFSTNSTAYVLKELGVEFDFAVVDEASQATIPEVLIPIDIAEKFTLAGDHKQLPPTVQVKELEKTLFEKLVEVNSSMLNIQYRMNEKLMEFPCREFYGCKLKADESVRDLRLEVKNEILTENPLQFIDTCNCENRWERQRKGSTSRENPLEAKVISKLLERMPVKPERIGVITPYEDQVELINRLAGKFSVEVNTVDAFQGREKDIIILSFVRSNPEGKLGFLMDERRLNVSLTRARMKLIAVGDSSTLSSLPIYRRLVDHFRLKGDVVFAEELLR